MRKKIKTLHIVFSVDNRVGGALHAALGVCKFLTRAGHPAEIAATSCDGQETGYLSVTYPEVRVHLFERSFPERFSNSAAFSAWFSAHHADYDIIEIHSLFTFLAWRAIEECRRIGKPYFIRPHGSLDPFDLRKRALLKRIAGPVVLKGMLADSAGVLVTTELESERLVTYGANCRRIVHPLPVVLPSGNGDGVAFRNRHGLPADARLVLFMSRIDYKKGLEFLIPAFSRLCRTDANLWLIIAGVGDAAHTAYIKDLIRQCGIQKNVCWVGFISGNEKADALAAAELFALPSLNENFGIVLVEAMNAGLPLLISNEVYIHREVAAARAGVVCRPATDDVALALKGLLEGNSDRREMGAAGRRLVDELYRPEQATANLLGTYNSVLAK